MKVTIFDRKKYITSMNNLIKLNAPSYVLEAYKLGYTKVVNKYYKDKAVNKRLNESRQAKSSPESLLLADLVPNLPFITEARKKRDEDFLKAFFVMTNLDIVTGKKLPPNTGRLLKDRGIFDSGLKELYKKLR